MKMASVRGDGKGWGKTGCVGPVKFSNYIFEIFRIKGGVEKMSVLSKYTN